MIRLPVIDAPAFSYSIRLDGVLYTLSFTYDDRLSGWYLDGRRTQQEGVPAVIQGWRLQPGVAVAVNPAVRAGWPGVMVPVISTEGASWSSREDWPAGRVSIYYTPASEVAELTDEAAMSSGLRIERVTP